MADLLRVFLDTSALFAAVISETGGARHILKLGEAGVVQVCMGPHVAKETEDVLERKSPDSKPYVALLLDRARVVVGPDASDESLALATTVISYEPDARIVAEALAADANYFVTFDRAHLIGSARVDRLPFPLGTAGDFLALYRARLLS